MAFFLHAARGMENDLVVPITASERRRPSRQDVAKRRIEAVKARHTAKRSLVEQLADRLTGVAASTPFLILHLCWFAFWIPANLGLLGIVAFDPFPFGLLTMVVSLEAIFLSIFVLMAQNRESAIAELREEMTLEIDMRMEEEVTKTLELVVGLYGRLGFSVSDDPVLREMLEPLDKERIERELAEQIGARHRPHAEHSE
jgi:uncharacterized membrane protein